MVRCGQRRSQGGAKPLAKGLHMSTCYAKVNERPSDVSRKENDFT